MRSAVRYWLVTFSLSVLAAVFALLLRADADDIDGLEATGIPLTECEESGGLYFSSGPPDAVTGAPLSGGGVEATCNQSFCHSSFPLNANSDSLSLNGPAQFSQGETITVNIDLRYAGMRRWGFELTALDENSLPYGTLSLLEPARTQKSTAGSGREYIKHTSAGTDFNT
ncbi:MAG TPA: hypothetical protein VLB27_00660, partial [candidate division Zixibacteria bacterium]|nr:hypothetical protein [candidate division Zixibacteria bacterium]